MGDQIILTSWSDEHTANPLCRAMPGMTSMFRVGVVSHVSLNREANGERLVDAFSLLESSPGSAQVRGSQSA